MAPLEKVTEELQKVAPSAIIELYQLTLNSTLHGSSTVYRFHAGVNGKNDGGSIVWAGNTYQAYPVEADGFAYNGEGQLPRPRLRISNQLGLVTTVLLQVNATTSGNDLMGAKIERIRALARHIDAVNFPGNTNPYGTPDSTAELPRETYYIARKVSENRDLVEFELASAFDLAGIRAPRRLCIANLCNWTYKGEGCGYNGDAYFDDSDQPVASTALDVCGKRLSSCEKRFAQVVATASVTAGSTTLSSVSSTEIASIKTGDLVTGHGIPQGTTVASKSGSTVTLSQAATSSSSYSRSGTLQSGGITMVVSSATGLVAGMTVSGSNVPSGTTIASISGTTLTLSIANNANAKGSGTTRSVTVGKGLLYGNDEYWLMSDTTGISVNNIAGNNSGITTNQPQGDKVYAGTKVSTVATDRVKISQLSKFDNGEAFTAVFWQPVTFSSATYTFTGSNSYTFGANRSLPFGSFPGVGGYLT